MRQYNMTIKDLPDEPNKQVKVKVVEQQGLSIVWFVPLIALIFGAWLGIKAINDQGEFITVEFQSGRGIVSNKTEVRYKGLVAGMVKGVEPSEDLKSVLVKIEMSDKFSPYLTAKTLFWLVTADVSLQGVSGLDTLLSGDYINMQPDINSGDEETIENFKALRSSPPLDLSTPGLHLTLQSDVLGSISKNSPVSFKQIPIGYVSGYRYVEHTKKVAISIFIERKYAHLVKANSQFWNSSGVQIVASLSSGLKVNTDSLASIIAGGITVGNLPFQELKEPARSGQVFELHPDFQAAEMGHEIELTLGWNSHVDRGAAILYQGVTIGVVESFIKIDPKARKIIAKAKVNPRIVAYLTENTQFYVVSPQISLSGVSNAESILKGTYLSVRPSLIGERNDKFTVFNSKPAYQYVEPGLHLILQTNDRKSLHAGTYIYYKQQDVGSVQAVETIGADQHLVHIHIKPEFEKYVSADSHFWNTSGFKVSANLKGIEVKAESLQTVLSGGIAFDLGHKDRDVKPENGAKFHLYANKELAQQRAEFSLILPVGMNIEANTRIIYRGKEVGSIQQVFDNGKIITLTAGVLPEYEHILTKNTQFWLVEAQLSLAGITDTNALLSGAYITFDVAEHQEEAVQTVFNLSANPPEKHASSAGLQLRIIAKHASVATPGSSVSYRGITVGQVDNVTLHENEDHVDINISIDEKYQHLIQADSRFYNASGMTLTGSLSDFVVKTESADAILRGGISFYNPESQKNSSEDEKLLNAVQEKDKFTLFDHIEAAKESGLAITVFFDDARGLNNNTKVTYQEHDVGQVERLIFDHDKTGVTALIFLNGHGKKLALLGSKFWFAKTEVGLVGSKNIASILDGGFIGVLPAKTIGNGKGEVKTHFKAENIPPVIEQLPFGLNIKLVTAKRGSVRIDNPVLYRQVQVGKVIGVGLSEYADKVNIFINITENFAPLVTKKSQFWNTSGFKVEAGIFAGIDIESESIETLLAGGIAFATPESEEYQGVEQGQQFDLHDNVDKDWLDWQPKIDISN
jgi:paraquat-inducible protein B